MEKKIENKAIRQLYQSVLLLKNEEQCERFFTDLCTERELISISQRLQVAKLLTIRKTYNEIEIETGASTATISRVNRALKSGLEGYDLVLQELIERDMGEE